MHFAGMSIVGPYLLQIEREEAGKTEEALRAWNVSLLCHA